MNEFPILSSGKEAQGGHSLMQPPELPGQFLGAHITPAVSSCRTEFSIFSR